MKGYGQFCPVAKAAEVIGGRWTLLILRELICGASRFNEIRRGVPLVSPSLLAQRLRELETADIIRRDGASAYRLTEAGHELAPLVVSLGDWGQRWVRSNLDDQDLDVSVLMWDVRRRIDTRHLPSGRQVIHFHFPELPEPKRDWWILVEAGEVDLCLENPGHEPDLVVITDLRTMTAIWMGDQSLGAARKAGTLDVTGAAPLRKGMMGWLGLSVFAGVRPHYNNRT